MSLKENMLYHLPNTRIYFGILNQRKIGIRTNPYGSVTSASSIFAVSEEIYLTNSPAMPFFDWYETGKEFHLLIKYFKYKL
jgi:hypothetical protein